MIYSTILPSQAAGAADTTVLLGAYSPQFYSGDTVTDIELVAPYGYETVVGREVDNLTIVVRQLRAGVVVSTFASVTVAEGVTISAEGPVPVPVGVQPVLLAGDVLDVVMHQNGAGLAVQPGLHLSVYVS